MRQRVLLAIALGCRPKLLIADEPTTALDVTTQAEILALLRDLRQRLGMAMLLISHDLGVVWEECDRVYVMFRSRIVESGATQRSSPIRRTPTPRASSRPPRRRATATAASRRSKASSPRRAD